MFSCFGCFRLSQVQRDWNFGNEAYLTAVKDPTTAHGLVRKIQDSRIREYMLNKVVFVTCMKHGLNSPRLGYIYATEIKDPHTQEKAYGRVLRAAMRLGDQELVATLQGKGVSDKERKESTNALSAQAMEEAETLDNPLISIRTASMIDDGSVRTQVFAEIINQFPVAEIRNADKSVFAEDHKKLSQELDRVLNISDVLERNKKLNKLAVQFASIGYIVMAESIITQIENDLPNKESATKKVAVIAAVFDPINADRIAAGIESSVRTKQVQDNIAVIKAAYDQSLRQEAYLMTEKDPVKAVESAKKIQNAELRDNTLNKISFLVAYKYGHNNPKLAYQIAGEIQDEHYLEKALQKVYRNAKRLDDQDLMQEIKSKYDLDDAGRVKSTEFYREKALKDAEKDNPLLSIRSACLIDDGDVRVQTLIELIQKFSPEKIRNADKAVFTVEKQNLVETFVNVMGIKDFLTKNKMFNKVAIALATIGMVDLGWKIAQQIPDLANKESALMKIAVIAAVFDPAMAEKITDGLITEGRRKQALDQISLIKAAHAVPEAV